MEAAGCERCRASVRMTHWRFCPACGTRLTYALRMPAVRVQAGWCTFCWQCGYPGHSGKCGQDREGDLPPAKA